MDDLLIPTKDLKTTKRFPPSVRGTIFESMLQAVSEELSIWRDAIQEQKTSFYDVDKMELERLTEISRTFGVPFIASVKSDLYFLQEEVRSIPFKIYYKGTPTLYKSFFYAVDRYGEMFIYVYEADVDNIVKSTIDPFDAAFTQPMNLSFRHLSKNDFSGHIEDWLKLDTGLYLDSEDALWNLDTSSSEISTNHIGLEYFIDRIILRTDTGTIVRPEDLTGSEIVSEYLMTKEYLDYLNQSMEFARRAKEVPHIGSQLSIQTDISGLCNSFDSSSAYSIPSLKLKAVSRPDYFSHINSSHDIASIEFGIKSQNMASVQSPLIAFPEDLASKVCSIPVQFKNQFEDSHFVGAVGTYQGQSLNGFEILNKDDIDGTLQNFTFTLPFAPIQKGNIVLEFKLPSGETKTISDDRRGSFLSIDGSGTIDYKTGICQFTTKFDYPQVDTLEQIEDERFHFTHTLAGGSEIVPGSVWLTFTVGDKDNQRTYMVNDIEDVLNSSIGLFNDPSIEHGSINYSSKVIDITFKVPIVLPDVKPLICKYNFPVDYMLPAETTLLASYFFTTQSIYITEVGFRSKDGKLVSYATFPPFEFNSSVYHLDFMILVQKPTVIE